jgi:hypothetical protein
LPAPKGPARSIIDTSSAVAAAGASAASIPQFADRRRGPQLGRDPLVEEARQLGERVARDGVARRHHVAAAIDQQPGLARGDHRRAQIDARYRAARALADAIGVRSRSPAPGAP